MAGHKSSGREFSKWGGLGFEFAGVVGLFFYFGYLADRRWDCEPWGLLIGGAIGLVGGLYLLAKEGFRMMRRLDDGDPVAGASRDGPPEERS